MRTEHTVVLRFRGGPDARPVVVTPSSSGGVSNALTGEDVVRITVDESGLFVDCGGRRESVEKDGSVEMAGWEILDGRQTRDPFGTILGAKSWAQPELVVRGEMGKVLRRYALSERPGEEVSLGRSSRCAIVLDDTAASRRHCRVVAAQDGLYLEDLDSRNGTLLNGKRLQSKQRLRSGDQIQVGASILEYVSYRDEVRAVPEPDDFPVFDGDLLPKRPGFFHRCLGRSRSMGRILWGRVRGIPAGLASLLRRLRAVAAGAMRLPNACPTEAAAIVAFFALVVFVLVWLGKNVFEHIG